MPSSTPHDTYDAIVHAHWRWTVNGWPMPSDEAEALAEQWSVDEGASPLHDTSLSGKACDFCGTPMETPVYRKPGEPQGDWQVERWYRLAHCRRCCAWEFRAGESTSKCMDAPTSVVAASVAKKFDAPFPEGCAAEIAQWLRRDPSLWHTMAPRDMERFVADVIRANHRQVEVVHVGKPGDLGIDVLFVDDGRRDWLVQVKRPESADAVEGFDTLQRLLGTLVLEGKLRGIIATTAMAFSRQLLTQKRRAEQRGYTIELLDRGKLDRMLNPMLPMRPWLALMRADFFWALDDAVRDEFVRRTTGPAEGVP